MDRIPVAGVFHIKLELEMEMELNMKCRRPELVPGKDLDGAKQAQIKSYQHEFAICHW